MKLLNNLVLVEPIPKPKQTASGILLPTNPDWSDDEKQYRVVACGPGRLRKKKGKPPVFLPMEVQPGDRVLIEVGLGCKGVLDDGTSRRVFDASQILLKW